MLTKYLQQSCQLINIGFAIFIFYKEENRPRTLKINVKRGQNSNPPPLLQMPYFLNTSEVPQMLPLSQPQPLPCLPCNDSYKADLFFFLPANILCAQKSPSTVEISQSVNNGQVLNKNLLTPFFLEEPKLNYFNDTHDINLLKALNISPAWSSKLLLLPLQNNNKRNPIMGMSCVIFGHTGLGRNPPLFLFMETYPIPLLKRFRFSSQTSSAFFFFF